MKYLACLFAILILTTSCQPGSTQQESASHKPNIIFNKLTELQNMMLNARTENEYFAWVAEK